MLNLLLTFCIGFSTICHSAIVPSFEFPDYEQALLNGFDVNFAMLKQDYLTKIHKLKEEAVECSFGESCKNFTDEIEFINNAFRQDAEKMKVLQKQSLQMYQRRDYIRCFDCVADYIDEMISDFCGIMDDTQEAILGGSSTSSPVNVTAPTSPTASPIASSANISVNAVPTTNTNVNATL